MSVRASVMALSPSATPATTLFPWKWSCFRRIVSEDGVQTLERADDEFLVFPPQFVVPQGGSQAVRFQYLGDPDIAQSIAYVIEAQEVPVVPEGFSGITTVYNLGAALSMCSLPVRAPSWRSAMSGARAVLSIC